MIGVVAKPSQIPAVEEFFELFKTPWEHFQRGRSYDVVVITGDEVPQTDAKLVVIYGPEIKRGDIAATSAHRSQRNVILEYRRSRLPIYGETMLFEQDERSLVCATGGAGAAGFESPSATRTVLRLGYDLFREVELLLSVGQPVENAQIPALEIHIAMLRDWILASGNGLLEIPPLPGGCRFAVCLTHDIDFIGIRNHKFDHTMWGFLYRATIGTLRDLARGRKSVAHVLKNWRAALSLPLVYLGWAKDFWLPFGWYLQVERNLSATYFLIPFKHRAGDRLSVPHASRRAAAYDVGDLPEWVATLRQSGCELGVHGIDAWHNVERARAELRRVADLTGEKKIGIRMHWLLQEENTYRVLDEAGYAYDSTAGFNETVGYRSGTTQVFRPFGTRSLLELPMHIQDGALFYPQRLDLTDREAWAWCEAFLRNAAAFGGVLTILWHDRSHGPERFWGAFYTRLVEKLRSMNVWFGSAGEVVEWFRRRREVAFRASALTSGTTIVRPRHRSEQTLPPLTLRHYRQGGARKEKHGFVDRIWSGESDLELDPVAGLG